MPGRPLALVTGASSGIGLELARLCAEHGHDLLLAADTPLDQAAAACRALGAEVGTVQADLATREGVAKLVQAARGRPVQALLANAGHGLGQAFLDQDFADIRHVIDTNVTGTLDLIHQVGRGMRDRRQGRILITGSIAGFLPGAYHAVYNASKAFIDNFSWALRTELEETGVTVTCLLPGPTDTEFFRRAGDDRSRVGAGRKDDPAFVARVGFEAMLRGDGDVVAGWKNRMLAAVAQVTPASVLAHQHARMAAPGTAKS
ncbi:SDR family NAD(P)-dependent oxidoreductase [Falsiroseomonas sp. E2-1-a20]|uniref:SDR family NAD(P)-dependent oxidoreductase n=1 Tax=Falsiroseomonas sp. E2-1-a20 TaxID=3239300 RepID=UPI003F3FD489